MSKYSFPLSNLFAFCSGGIKFTELTPDQGMYILKFDLVVM